MVGQDTTFLPPTLRIKGQLHTLQTPWVMGIINLTPDSFHAPSRATGVAAVLRQAETMLAEGADLLDLGAYSTRPGADDIPEAEERQRLLAPLDALAKEFPEAIFSVDTFRSGVARAAVEHGAALINDISGGQLDAHMFATVADLQVPYVLMHLQGTPQTMQQAPRYDDVVGEVMQFFSRQIHQLRLAGVADIILDPGFGFGKTVEHNYALFRALPELVGTGFPVLVGVSRKSMINRVLGTKAAEALHGTTVLHAAALERGAHLLRVHDVREARQAVQLMQHVAPPGFG